MKTSRKSSKENFQLFAHKLARGTFGTEDVSIVSGAGEDDVAALTLGDNCLLVSSDIVNTKRISDTYGQRDLVELGRYCVRQNVSDILGSGGNPRWFLLSLVLDKKFTQEDLRLLFNSVHRECARFGMTVVGGDTKEGDSVVIGGTIIGTRDREIWMKNTCIPESDIFVSGNLSGVTAALCLLEFSNSSDMHTKARSVLYQADLPLDVLARVKAIGAPLSATDISDGLGYSICEFTRCSNNIGVEIDLDKIPLHPLTQYAAKEIAVSEEAFSFAFGGDFQIVFTVPNEFSEKMVEAGAIKIGRVTKEAGSRLIYNGNVIGDIPEFGHLDFEDLRPVDRFYEFAKVFSNLV